MLPASTQISALVASHTSAVSNTATKYNKARRFFNLRIVTYILFIVFFCLSASNTFAQQDSYDLIKHTPLKGWKKETKSGVIIYTKTDNAKGSWCQIGIYKSTNSKGSIAADFENEWQHLIVTPYKVTDTPQVVEVPEADGWRIKNGGAKFTFNNQDAIAMLTTISGYGRAASIIASTNSQDYLPDVQKLIGSIGLVKPDTMLSKNSFSEPVKNNPSKNSNSGSFAFTTTNFDDGWTSTVQEDWVLTTKGNIKVLIHYPNKNADEYNTVLLDGLKTAWNVLVAPRYRSASNFEFKPIQSWQSIEFAEADMIEKDGGKTVHVVLFKKNFSGGEGKYIEFITANKNSFEQEFGVYSNDAFAPLWDKMANMAYRNKFAVASTDLTGKWTDRFSANTYYANIYTGISAGMSTYSSSQFFDFNTSKQTYQWEVVMANSYGGKTNFNSGKGAGSFKLLNNWQIYFSNMEGKAKTYNAYFSCVKGARILWLQDTGYGGYSAYGKSD